MQVKDKVVIVTGAGSGIGKATAEFLAQYNYKLILCGRNKEQLQNLENSILFELMKLIEVQKSNCEQQTQVKHSNP